MAFTPIPPVYTPVPNSNQGRDNFNVNTQGFVDSLPGVVAGMNNAGVQINQLRDEASDFATSANNSASRALSSADIAAGAARNMGPWSGKTGAVAPPYSVTHAGKIWILQQSLANIASVTPGTNANIWFDYTGSITGVDVVTSPTDTTPGRLVNTQWDFKRAALSGQAYEFPGVSIDTIAVGTFGLFSETSNTGTFPARLPGETEFWIISRQALYNTGFIDFAMSYQSRYFQPKSRLMYRHNYANDPNILSAWEEIGSGTGGISTSEMIGFVNLGTPGNGAVNLTLDLSSGRYFYVNLNTTDTAGGFTFSLSNIPSSGAVDCVLFIMRPTRKGNIVLPANVKWASGVVPGLSSAANSVAAIHIWKVPGWTNFEAAVNAMSTAP